MRPNKINIKLFVAVYSEDKEEVKKLEDIMAKLSSTHTCTTLPSGNNMKYAEIILFDTHIDINEPNFSPISDVDWYIRKASEFFVENGLEFSWADYSYITVSSQLPVCISEFDINNNGELNQSVTLETDLDALRELSSRGIAIHFDNEVVLNSTVFQKLYWLWTRSYKRMQLWLRPQTSEESL